MRFEAAERLRAERILRGMTLRTLAGRAGVSIATASATEAGETVSLETYARIATALGLRPEFVLVDPKRRSDRPRLAEDPVHAAMGDTEAAQLRRPGSQVALDEPYQHYQFAGRADLVAWDLEQRALLHLENRTRFPNLQDAFGSYNAKRAYLPGVLAQRLGLRGGWRSVTHAMVVLWSSEVLHVVRLREASFRAVCPDPPDAFAAWWAGEPRESGIASTLVIFDPLDGLRATRRRFVGLDDVRSIRPRYAGYAEAAHAVA